MANNLVSLQVEKHVLGGIIKNPDVFADIERFVQDSDFFNRVHSVLFSIIKQTLSKQEKIDKIILAQKIKNLGIVFKDDIDIFDYVDSIAFTQITPTATIDAAKELVKLRVLREVCSTSSEIEKYVRENANEPIEKLIANVDSIYSKKIESYSFNDEPENVFDNLAASVLETGKNPKDETGFKTPFSEFNRLYGGLRPANIYAIASRPGQGKTTFLNYIAYKTSIINKIPVLVLDTEMMTKEIQFRKAAALTGVPLWYLETGNWNRNVELRDKVTNGLNKIEKTPYYHHHIGNRNIDEVCAIIRRWYWSRVGRGNPCLVVYDYLKLTGEKVGANWAEHQAIGEKVDKLKKISEEINCPIFTAIQINRTGENFNRSADSVVDDSSVLALSDRLQWFASFVSIFRRKTIDEIALDGTEFGTHKLVPLKTRFQGKDAAGHQDLVRRRLPDGSQSYVQNYLSFDVNNFALTERGSLNDIIEHQRAQITPDDGSQNDGETL
jgi:replicative DNA helicase